MSNGASVSWSELEGLSDVDLAVVCAAALHVVEEEGDLDYAELPRATIARNLQDALKESGVDVTDEDVAYLISDEKATRALALTVLASLGADETLRTEIDDVYARRNDLMVLDAGSLVAGALIVLAIKVRRIKVGDVKIDFFELKTNLIDQIRQLLRQVIDQVIGVARQFDQAFDPSTETAQGQSTLALLESRPALATLWRELAPRERSVDGLLQAIAELARPEHETVETDWEAVSAAIHELRATDLVATVVTELAVVAHWEHSRSTEIWGVTSDSLPHEEWTNLVLPLAKDLMALDAIWSCESLCNEAVGTAQLRMMYGFYEDRLEGYLGPFRALLAEIEGRRRDARDLLAYELEQYCAEHAELRSYIAALIWALGDAPHAHLVVGKQHVSRRLGEWAIVQTLHYQPPDPLVGRLWRLMGESAFPLSNHPLMARRLSSTAGTSPVHLIARGSSPPLLQTLTSALLGYFAGGVDESSKRDLIFVDGTWGEILSVVAPAFALRLGATTCLVFGDTDPQTAQRWSWLAINAARHTASMRNAGFADEDDVSLSVPFSYLPVASDDDLVDTLDLIERFRIAGLEYWLLTMRPPLPPPGDVDADALIDREARILTDMRGLRFVRLLPELPRHFRRHVISVDDWEAAGDLHDQGRALERLSLIPQELNEVWSALDVAAPEYARVRRNPFLGVGDFVHRLTSASDGGVLDVVGGSSG